MLINPSPVLIFTYKRLEPLKQTVQALQKNILAESSDLYIFSDGAKNETDIERVNSVREYIKTVTGFKSVTIHESATNKGLANSIIQGVTLLFEKSENVIVLEDDLLTTPNFLSFMNQALEKYKNASQVFSISGYSFDLGKNIGPDSYFLNRGWSWGWATWKNRWEKVDWQVKDYASFRLDRKRQREFARGGSDLNKMLRCQMKGLLDSWAIRWFYHQYKVNGLTLYPVQSKVYNNGFDDSATHTNGSDKRYRPLLDTTHSTRFNFPDNIRLDDFYYQRFMKKMSIKARIVSKLDTLILRIKKYA